MKNKPKRSDVPCTAGSSTIVPPSCGPKYNTGPVWIRLPREGTRCPHTNLTRASLNKLILGKDPQVESIVLKENGTARGVRLIRLSSLLEFLESIADSSQAVDPDGSVESFTS